MEVQPQKSDIAAGHRWQEQDLDKFRSMAKAGKSIKQISESLHRTETAVQLTARRYGIEIYTPGRLWRAEDLEYLRRSWGYVRLDILCQKLHRSPAAIAERARRMKLGAASKRSEDIPLKDFALATGIGEYRIIYSLAPRYGFPLKSRKVGRRQRQSYWFVDFEKILTWMQQHQNLYDASLIKEGFFVEPDWLKEKRRRDCKDNSYLNCYIRRRPWTERELSLAKFLAEEGWTPTEIATRVDRSPGAISNKLMALRAEKRNQREQSQLSMAGQHNSLSVQEILIQKQGLSQ